MFKYFKESDAVSRFLQLGLTCLGHVVLLYVHHWAVSGRFGERQDTLSPDEQLAVDLMRQITSSST
jgi:hypothetical protein